MTQGLRSVAELDIGTRAEFSKVLCSRVTRNRPHPHLVSPPTPEQTGLGGAPSACRRVHPLCSGLPTQRFTPSFTLQSLTPLTL